MDVNRYKNHYIEIYPITTKESTHSGSLVKTSEEITKIKQKISDMNNKKVTVYQDRLKEQYHDNGKIYTYIRVPVHSEIVDNYLINVYKRKVLHNDTFPILRDYYSEKEIEVYYNDDYEYNIVHSDGMSTYNFTYLNRGNNSHINYGRLLSNI